MAVTLLTATTAVAGPGPSSGAPTERAAPLAPPPAPQWVDLGEGSLWDDEGRISPTLEPSVVLGLCGDGTETATTQFEVEVAPSGAPEQEVATGEVAAVADSNGCYSADWTLPGGVLADKHAYDVRARSLAADGTTSMWSEPMSFRTSLPPMAPVPELPASDDVVTEAMPVLTARVAADAATPLAGVFRIVSQASGLTVAEGTSGEADAAGTVTWSPTVSLWADEFAWQVLATDGTVQSAWSDLVPFRVSLPPSKPTVHRATAVRRGAEVAWFPALTSVEDPILDYTVRAMPGDVSVVVPADESSVTLPGLPAGDYELTVTARNQRGSSPASAPRTVAVLPATPLAPQDVTSTLDGTSAQITWSPPTDTGDAPITSYAVAPHPWGSAWFSPVETSDFTTLLTDLTFGEWYVALVTATNAYGRGPAGGVGFMPFTTPDSPTGVTVKLGDGALAVSWEAPGSDGGATVNEYVVRASPGGLEMRVSHETAVLFRGLENGTPYTFTVAAVNEAGEGPQTTPSSPRAPVSQAMDSDGDRLPDILEERAGSNSLLVDSDFDGLDDHDEVLVLAGLTSPTSGDTDGDGVADAEADSDGDGISNAAEIAAGTEPSNSDTDEDRLPDGLELGGTASPTVADSDGDGLGDADELSLGLDPLVHDSDGDGWADSSAPTERSLSADGASVVVVGAAEDVLEVTLSAAPISFLEGAVTAAVTVALPDDMSAPGPEPASAAAARSSDGGPGVEGSSPIAETIEPQGLVLELPAAHDTAGRQFAAFAWQPETVSWVQAPNGVVVSDDDHTVTITSPELGVTYTVVDLDEWRAYGRQCDLAASGEAPLDVEVVLDDTPSVAGHDPTGERYRAVERVLDTLEPGDDARLRAFGLEYISYGWGYSVGPDFGRAPMVPEHGTATDQVRAQLVSMATNNDYWEEGDATLEGFAEEAFGGTAFPGPGAGNPFVSTYTFGCTREAIVLVTDGMLVPEPPALPAPGYVPFRDRTETPVHVLDVGPGGAAAQWLREVAEKTGGSYTHVPTASTNPTWRRDGEAVPSPADMELDDDQDGISNWIETVGVRSATSTGPSVYKGTFFSDPHDADTDDDGLTDGQEFGQPLSVAELGMWTSTVPITTYRVQSDPALADGDDDGLSDAEETELGLNALHSDPDYDELVDGEEAIWGTNPAHPDSDRDGFLDGQEARDYDEGLDPWIYNEVIDPNAWLHDFYLGAICGDVEFCRQPTLAWLAGNITSGLLLYGDVRDFVWALKERNALNAAFAGIGLIPGGGDVAGAAGKILGAMSALAPAMKRPARQLLLDQLGAVEFLKRFDPALVKALEDAGGTTSSMARLLAYNDPEHLRRLIDSPLRRDPPDYARHGGPPNFLQSGKAGEDLVRLYYNDNMPNVGPASYIAGGFRRVPDVVTAGLDTPWPRMHESKVGYVRSLFSQRQVNRDALLMSARPRQVEAITWHFFASDWTGRIGPSPRVLELLKDNNIPFILHIPG